MVLAMKVGKRRSFVRGVILTFITAGIYLVYWNYRAPNEVYRQFELAREGRDEGVVWYILGFPFFPLQFVYFWIMVSNVDYVRRRMGLAPAIRPAAFAILQGAGVTALYGGLIAFVLLMGESEEIPESSLQALLVGVALYLVVVPLAYFLLQRSINQVWQAYDVRMAYLRAEATAHAAPPSAPRAPPMRSYADLLPPAHPTALPQSTALPDVLPEGREPPRE